MTAATRPAAECRNGHPWTADQVVCAECGAPPRVQWGPVSAIKPPGFPHLVADWLVSGLGFLLIAMVSLVAALRVESEEATVAWLVAFVVLLLTGWFFVTIGAVIKGASIALADRDRS